MAIGINMVFSSLGGTSIRWGRVIGIVVGMASGFGIGYALSSWFASWGILAILGLIFIYPTVWFLVAYGAMMVTEDEEGSELLFPLILVFLIGLVMWGIAMYATKDEEFGLRYYAMLITPFALLGVTAGYFVGPSILARQEKERRRMEEQRRKNREEKEFESMVLGVESLIEYTMPTVTDPIILGGLKSLQGELLRISQTFYSGSISYEEAMVKILALWQQAEILSQPSPKETYYDILGITSYATQDEIKKAYRDKIKEYHPDKFTNEPDWVKKQAEEMSKKLNEASGVLQNSNRKKEYDEEIGL